MKLNPSDLDKFSTVESCQKISVDKLIKEVNKQLKAELLRSSISALGFEIELTTTKTRFNGEKYWLVCPTCKHRKGVLYHNPINNSVGCKTCLKLNYLKQRYKN